MKVFWPGDAQPLMAQNAQTSPDLRVPAAPTAAEDVFPQSFVFGRGVGDPAVCFLPAHLPPIVDGFIRTLLRAHHDGLFGGLRIAASQPVPGCAAAAAASPSPRQSVATERPVGCQERSRGLFRPLQAVGAGIRRIEQRRPHTHFRRPGAASSEVADPQQRRRQRKTTNNYSGMHRFDASLSPASSGCAPTMFTSGYLSPRQAC